ncbi:MAG: DUF6263 family protein [Planctomycetaceae bacterium]
MSITRASVILMILAVSVPSQTSAQDVLRWKFQRNEQLKYTAVQNMETLMKVGDNEIKQALNHTMDVAWKVLDVGANGSTVMHQVVTRAQIKIAGGPDGEVGFDTANPVESENLQVKAMGEAFGKIVNQNFTITMQPTGEIDSVEIPAGLREAINTSAAGNTAALNEDTLKQMMKQSAVTLPANAVSPGSKWTSTQSVPLPFGTINVKSTMTLVRTDGTSAIIDVVPEISVTPKEGAPVKVSVTKSSGRGQVTFDVVKGHVTKSELVVSMDMEIDSGQRNFRQTVNQSTALTLVP